MGIARGTIVLLGTWLAVAVVSGQEEGVGHQLGNHTPQGANAARAARAVEFLRRLDTNGNGMIEEEEATGVQRQLLERILGRNGIAVKFPVSIEQVVQAMNSAARSAGNAATGGGSPPAVAGSSPAAGPPMAGAAQVAGSRVLELQPPVPGFNTPRLPPVPGFGASPGKLANPPVVGDTTTPPDNPPGISPSSNSSESAPGKAPAHKSGRFLTAKERLPPGLPDWFLQKADSDGQVSMAEFTSHWTPEKVREFESYDRNHDGFITAAECLQTEKEKQSASRRPNR